MTTEQLNISAHQTAQLLIERLRDETVDERTAIEAAIQQLRLLVEQPKSESIDNIRFPRVAK